MTDREPSKAAESPQSSFTGLETLLPSGPGRQAPRQEQSSFSGVETIAPSGLADSTPPGSGPFTSLPVQFGRYRVTKLLGRGAMGTVYHAHDPDLGKEVALKVPNFLGDEDPVLLERFRREARAAGDLNHANICGMYEVGQIGATHFIAMQYIDGRPLSDYISAELPQRRVAGIIRKLAVALDQAHERGIVHRDLKPANVMIDVRGEPVIMDFGLARRFDLAGDVRATQSGMIVGSPAYMSPEQARAEHDQIGPRTDIYGLGVLFFELLTGSLPFRGPMVVVLGQIATQPPPKPSSLRADVDPRLESLCLKMLAKKSQDRPVSMAAVAQTLSDWSQGGGSSPGVAVSADAAPVESVALAPVKPKAPPRPDKAEGIEAQKKRVIELLDEFQTSEAIELLEKMVHLRDARFAPLVTWARRQLKDARAIEQTARESSEPLCDTARQLLQHYDYAGAAELLAHVPPAHRTREVRALIEEVNDLRDEWDHLHHELEEALSVGNTETVPALVNRLVKLKPNNKAIKQLADDVKEHGVQRAIARHKGQRFTSDSPERTFETKHIFGSVVLVAGLFVGVSLLVRNYLANSALSGPMKSPDQPAQLRPQPVPVAVTPAKVPVVTPITPPSTSPPKSITSRSTGMTLALIPAGTFQMGSPASETYRSTDEGPQHKVRISQPFYMGVHEVTQGEYESVMGTNPSSFSKTGYSSSKMSDQDTSRFPVETVSWYDAVEFCNQLSAKDGMPAYYALTNVQGASGSIQSASVSVSDGNGYRLPTEAEWEYACRANTTTTFHFGDVSNGDQANINGTFPYGTTTKGPSLGRTTTVGSYGANAFGLHDLHGNVREWCEDLFDTTAYATRTGITIDPVGKNGAYRVLRGGSWLSTSVTSRSAVRYGNSPVDRGVNYGLRVVFSSAAVRTP